MAWQRVKGHDALVNGFRRVVRRQVSALSRRLQLRPAGLQGQVPRLPVVQPPSRRVVAHTEVEHLADVRREAESIVAELQLPNPFREAVVLAAEHHDVGKALEQWQNKLPEPAPQADTKWAKAPFIFAVRPEKPNLDATSVEELLTGAGIHTLVDVRDLATLEKIQADIVRGELGVQNIHVVTNPISQVMTNIQHAVKPFEKTVADASRVG